MEKIKMSDTCDASIVRKSGLTEEMKLKGQYFCRCFDKDGNLKWEDTIDNVVTTDGRNLVLDTILEGAGYTVTGPYLGLISSVSYTGEPVEGDTMASHATWYEVSATTYFPTVAARLTTAGNWDSAAAGSKAMTAPLAFSIITNGGTLKGCFLVIGSGASATLGNTGGTLYSAGVFGSGDKVVSPGDTLNVTYTSATA